MLIHKMGDQIEFSASESTDLDDDITNYLWDLGGGNIVFCKTVNYTYDLVGPQTIKLTVSDSQELTDTETIKLDIVPPFTSITWTDTRFDSSPGQILVIGDNLDPDNRDVFTMKVWSDSDTTGFETRLIETGDSTNIFTAVGFVNTQSNADQSELKVNCFDKIYAGYTENQLPNSWNSVKKSDYLAESRIGIGCIQ